ncbi:long-chain-fatty-acid--CoA ligase [Brevibacillus agri]|uniref:Long-chain-fatty-acid--CoA ligase n=1 Tax=Brevibacillus agri TaxID=51101 RepID=A0A3M8B173_9BACL|nr:long-chain-fatty-acid--CoA ligase [Brevibacillus agri]MBG9566111.1 long-chain fatty acid--CoA ligase [Brevibacillus agri]MCG5253301.1 long-chain-fatty-acid--CoA ligase [Brevibacillus agri]MDN4092166.1 long-chain-fatty-acid--CoA ligase [Brevibacillus agri]MDR9507444.1 long-chain-fatty-acid--CoA ligase [Brevibacillus agri]QAV13891.1 long-chain fatty acid--CoA ligase [Brevibacillus agri]
MYHLNENLRQSAQNFPDHPAYIFSGETTTYRELNQQVDELASGLAKLGIGKGDAVALIMDNRPQFVSAYYAILRTGAAVVPMNPIYTPREISFILANSQAKAVIALAALEPVLTPLKEQLEHVTHLIYTEATGDELTLEQVAQAGDGSFVEPERHEDDLAVILYTSGTTGQPKGAMLSHRNMASNAEAMGILFELLPEDRVVAVLPMFHVFCMTVCLNGPIRYGASIIIIPRFHPVEVVNTIREQKATCFAGVPTMYNYMLQLPNATKEDFASVRLCCSGGASMPVELLHKFEAKYEVMILEGYGLSEAAPATAFNPLRGTRKPGSVGVNIPHVVNKVVDPEGNELPRGEVGELVVQGPNVMLGYLGLPEDTAATLRNGWLYTGDMARMDEEGYVYIVDRKKDMILVDGYNVYPREVEEVLYQHPAIIEAAVIGVPDEVHGEAVKAFVALKEVAVSQEDIVAFCQDKLAKYKVPRLVEIVPELPKNSTGKILRRSLRK